MSAPPPWVIVKFGDQVAPNLEAGASMSLAELAQHFEDVLVAGALDGVRGLGIELEFARAWEPVTPQQLQELVDRADAAEPSDELVNMESFLRVVVPDRVDPQTLLDVLNAATDAVEVAYIGSPVGLPSVVGTTNPHFTALGYLQPSPLGVDAIRAWELGADGSGVSIIDVETGFYFEHRDLPVVPFLAGENSDGGKYHGAAVLGILVAKDNAFGGVGLAPAASCSAMSYTSAAGDSEPPELAARIVEAALTLSAGDVLVVEAQLFAELDGRDDTPVPAETDLQVFRAIWHATRLGIVVVEAAGNGSSNVDHYTDPHSGAHILDPTSGDFRDSGAVIVGAATSTLPRTKEPSSNFGGFIDCHSWGQHILAPGAIPTMDQPPPLTPTSYWPLDPGFGHTSGATAIIGGVATLTQDLARRLPNGPGTRRSKEMRALLNDPDLGTSTADAEAQPVGRQPNLATISQQFL